jgi:predicted RecA/RadA family phage recombinase
MATAHASEHAGAHASGASEAGVQPLVAPGGSGAEVAGFQPGNVIPVPVAAACAPGDVILQGKIVGISRSTCSAAGQIAQVAVEGVFPVSKSTSLAVTSGDPMKFNTSTKVVDATGTVLMGYAVDTVAASAATARVKLVPSAV